MDPVDVFLELFPGNAGAYLKGKPTGQTTKKGKVEFQFWTEKRPMDAAAVRDHLEGIASISAYPLNADSKVRWGAIDIDNYQDDLRILNEIINMASLPLVLCQSKSGGPHLFLFVREWVPANLMIEKLTSLAAYLGKGDHEIFPKQVAISQAEGIEDYGNALSLPYFGGLRFGRYGLDKEGRGIDNLEDFYQYAMSRSLTLAQLEELAPPDEEAEYFQDGPPCLERIFSRKESSFRNTSLLNAGIYFKKSFPDTWKEEMMALNSQFDEPLEEREVSRIIGSLSKKDYRYQCKKQPLCQFCDARMCKKRPFGISGNQVIAGNRSLTKFNSEPPVWFLDIEDQRIMLNTEQLLNPRAFQVRVVEACDKMVSLVKKEEWDQAISELMENMTVIEVDKDMTRLGMFIELLREFGGNADEEDISSVLNGVPYRSLTHLVFRSQDLDEFLARKRYSDMKKNEINSALALALGATKTYHKLNHALGRKGVRLWEVPLEKLEVYEDIE